jgi:hypothetical protein
LISTLLKSCAASRRTGETANKAAKKTSFRIVGLKFLLAFAVAQPDF